MKRLVTLVLIALVAAVLAAGWSAPPGGGPGAPTAGLNDGRKATV
jgi:hypothetical protein